MRTQEMGEEQSRLASEESGEILLESDRALKIKIIRDWALDVIGSTKLTNILMNLDDLGDDEIGLEIEKKPIAVKVQRHRALKLLKSRRDELRQLLDDVGF